MKTKPWTLKVALRPSSVLLIFVLGVAVRTSFLEPAGHEDTSLSYCFQGFEFWSFSCLLTWELSTSELWVVRTSFLVTSLTTLSLVGIHKSCGGFSLALHGLRNTKLTGDVFAGTIGFGFAIGEPSLEVASWPLFDMALCFPLGSERKLLKRLQENIEKLVTRETLFS